MSLRQIPNFILTCDSYKLHHYAEYPEDTKWIYSVVVPRKPSGYTDEIVAMGATAVADYLTGVKITLGDIDEAERVVHEYGYDFNREDWGTIVEEYNGRLPLAIYGVEEGSVVKPNTPILGVINTDQRFFWLVSYVETVVQRLMWKMSTVASQSRFIYQTIDRATEITGANAAMVQYKLHNFGDRGADGQDSAILAGVAHAALFSGSDCLAANPVIKSLYCTNKSYLSSVDATEHSVMCSNSDADEKDDWGAAVMSVERLEEAVARTKRGIGIPLQSVVIDTYDDERFVKQYIGIELKDRIINSGGVLVARPDSGDPLTRPIQVIQWLDEAFGHTVNEQGFKVLHPSVRVIQGDGINENSIVKILSNLIEAGYSVDNLTFGMGGGLTHGGSRDQFSFSMKAVARGTENGQQDLLKAPKTDSGKTSLKGLVRTRWDDEGEVETFVAESLSELTTTDDGWKCYFENGFHRYIPLFDEVRARARS